MTHLAAAIFFTFALLAAAVALHLLFRRHWTEMLFALRGEWHGAPHYRFAPVSRPGTSAPTFVKVSRRAAF